MVQNQLLWMLVFALPVLLAFLAVLFTMHPRGWVDALIVLTVATTPLGVYALPLPAGQSLQFMRIVLLIAITLWSVSFPVIRARLPRSAIFAVTFTLIAGMSTIARSENLPLAMSLIIALCFGCLYSIWLPQVLVDRHGVQVLVIGLLGAGAIMIGFGIYQYFAWFTGIGMQGYSFSIPGATFLRLDSDVVQATRYGSLFRPTLPFSSPSHLSPCLSAVLLATLPLQLHAGTRKVLRLLLILFHVALFGLLVATLSRGAWIGFAAGLLVVLRYDRRLLLSKRMWAAIAVGLTIVIIAMVALPDLVGSVLGRFDSSVTAGSDEGHLEFLLLALNLVPQAPIFGVGLGNYEAITGIVHAHNVYAMTLAELGVVGLFSLLCWASSVIWYGANAIHMSVPRTLERAVAVGLLAAYISVLFNNIFQQSFYAGFLWVISGAVGALYYVARSQRVTHKRLAVAAPYAAEGAIGLVQA